MMFFEGLFNGIKRLSKILKYKVGPLTISSIVFFIIFTIGAGLFKLSMLMGLQQLEKISYLFIKILFMYVVLLIPFANYKYAKALRTTSHKSYLYFIVFVGVVFWYLISEVLKIFPTFDYQKIFVENQVNIVFTIYSVLTILWFAYQLIYTNELSKLRKQIQLYIFIVTFIQLFIVNKYSNFEYSISVLIITYTYIQYLFEVKSEREEKSKT